MQGRWDINGDNIIAKTTAMMLVVWCLEHSMIQDLFQGRQAAEVARSLRACTIRSLTHNTHTQSGARVHTHVYVLMHEHAYAHLAPVWHEGPIGSDR